MATSIRTILHTTSQRSNLVRFYREGLGLGDPDHASGEESFQLGDLTLSVSSGDSRLRGPVPRTALTFSVDDLEEQVAHLKALGVPFDIEPSSSGNGSGSAERRAVCRDPDGNFVILLSGPKVARRQLDDDGRPSKKSKGKKPAPKTSSKKKPAKSEKKPGKKKEKKKKKK